MTLRDYLLTVCLVRQHCFSPWLCIFVRSGYIQKFLKIHFLNMTATMPPKTAPEAMLVPVLAATIPPNIAPPMAHLTNIGSSPLYYFRPLTVLLAMGSRISTAIFIQGMG